MMLTEETLVDILMHDLNAALGGGKRARRRRLAKLKAQIRSATRRSSPSNSDPYDRLMGLASNGFPRLGFPSKEEISYLDEKRREEIRAAKEWAYAHGAPKPTPREQTAHPYRTNAKR